MSDLELDLSITPRIFFAEQFSSKKKAIEVLASILAEQSDLNIADILEALMNRERLGSTAIGSGIAIPHGRITQLDQAMGALIIIENGLDLSAPDNQPVDILFGMLVPEKCCDQHLSLLKDIASIATQKEALELFRKEKSGDTIFRWIINNHPQIGDTLK